MPKQQSPERAIITALLCCLATSPGHCGGSFNFELNIGSALRAEQAGDGRSSLAVAGAERVGSRRP